MAHSPGLVLWSLGKACRENLSLSSLGAGGQALNQNQEQESSGFGDKQTGPISVRCGVSLPPRLSEERAGDA